MAVCSELGVSVELLHEGLRPSGVGRRFSVLGNVTWDNGSALLVDGYDHHPTELRATINAAREAYQGKRLVMVFQPHASVAHATARPGCRRAVNGGWLVLLDVYAAGEDEIVGADSRSLARSIGQAGLLILCCSQITVSLRYDFANSSIMMTF